MPQIGSINTRTKRKDGIMKSDNFGFQGDVKVNYFKVALKEKATKIFQFGKKRWNKSWT